MVLFDLEKILALKAEKRDWSTSEHCTAVIYELITALQLTSKYFFTYLSIKSPFFFNIWFHI